ncbi:MAG: hypothetical protein GYA24_16415 [Candidatus Lokiarchaeota archaeon]|nr:hypothetical protein [Candidatus Lokiarchaeota archaeon]
MDSELLISCRFQGKILADSNSMIDTRDKWALADVSYEIKPDISFQHVLGFGYSFEPTSCYNLMRLPPRARHEVLSLLVDPARGAGLNLWRLCIGSPDFSYKFYSYDDLPGGETDEHLDRFSIDEDRRYVIPVVKEALAINPGIQLFASPWSPPAWMKIPEPHWRKGTLEERIGGNGMCSGRLDPRWYDAYATYFVKYLQAYKAEGIDIKAVTVQNEPHHNWVLMPTCWWDGENERDFIRDHLGPKIQQSGLATEIWCWDHNWGQIHPARYPVTVLSDPGAAQYVSSIAFHHYDMVHVSNMGKFHSMFPGKHVQFTEGSLLWLWGAARLAAYLRNWSQSYVGWVPFIDTNGDPNIGPFKTKRTMLQPVVPGAEPVIKEAIPAPHQYPVDPALLDGGPFKAILARYDYYLLAHYSKFIRRGALRIKSTRKMPLLGGEVSFKNPDGSIVSVITNRRRVPMRVHVALHGRHYRFQLPARSIATLHLSP